MRKRNIELYVPWLLLMAYGLVIYLLDAKGGDLWLAKVFYQWQGNQWLLRDHWLTEQILHKGARVVNYLMLLTVLALTVLMWRTHGRQSYQSRAYFALFVSLLTSFILIALLKSLTNKACPWNLQLFGGIEPYYHLLQSRPASLPPSQCFPAGHASVGYAWVALFYFFSQVKPHLRWFGLGTGLITGLILGLNQQLRGAHFLSHDVTTLFLCWLVATSWFRLLYRTAGEDIAMSSAQR